MACDPHEILHPSWHHKANGVTRRYNDRDTDTDTRERLLFELYLQRVRKLTTLVFYRELTRYYRNAT